MDEVAITPLPPDKFGSLIGRQRAREFASALSQARQHLSGRTVWCVNSTATGGGVAEMLNSVLCYLAGAGISVRWLVIDANEEFFDVTKGLHHLLHGHEVEGLALGQPERATYEAALAENQSQLVGLVAPGDPVVLHDPQALGLAPALADHGARVIWNCHIGADQANAATRQAWDFLRPYLRGTRAQVFSRPQYAWEALADDQVVVIPPCVDAFSPKNQVLEANQVAAILDACGLVPGEATGVPAFVRQDGSSGKVSTRAAKHEDSELTSTTSIVTQISRWDPLKDHVGVMEAFAQVPATLGAHLVLAGPAPESVADDPEGQSTFQDLLAAWEKLPSTQRQRVHVMSLPMDDPEENAAIVNALQRRSDVIVQKSLAEGFGLTVAEAMLKGRPTVGSRVGGIQDQISHGSSGLLVGPTDQRACADAIAGLLEDPAKAKLLGQRAVERVIDHYLAPSYLSRNLQLIEDVMA